MKTSLFFLFLLASLAACSQQPAYQNVDNKKFTELMKQSDAVVLDVRTPDEFKGGHLPNALLIDYNSGYFAEQVEKLDRDKTYLVYCASGGRSPRAAQIMTDKGFKHVYNLEQGISRWNGDVVK
jgi:rhodanese-related sulfurtransferase